MKRYQDTCEQLRQQIPIKARRDEFNSEVLRHEILESIKYIVLPEDVMADVFDKLGREEKIKISYLSQCGSAGNSIACELLKKHFNMPPNCCYHHYMLKGAREIGNAIGMEYGRELYPIRRYMRDKGIAGPTTEKSKIESFGFFVHNYRDSCDLTDVCLYPEPPRSDLFYDEINERYIETYLFPDYEQADTAHRQWREFLGGKSKESPMKYGFVSVTAPNCATEVDFVSLMEKSVQSSTVISAAGVERKTDVFTNLYEALAQYQEANKVAMTQKPASPPDAVKQPQKSVEPEIADNRQPQIPPAARQLQNVSKKVIEK